jgi:prophage antirepressor-like protein
VRNLVTGTRSYATQWISLSDVARLLGISENAALALARHRINNERYSQYHFCARERHCRAFR